MLSSKVSRHFHNAAWWLLSSICPTANSFTKTLWLTFAPPALYFTRSRRKQAGHGFTIYSAALNTERSLRESTPPSQVCLLSSRYRFPRNGSGKGPLQDPSQMLSAASARPPLIQSPCTSVNKGVCDSHASAPARHMCPQ